MATKAKHAFGALENIDAAIASGKVDAYDILFVKDSDGKPYVGWIDKDGNKVVVDDSEEFAALENQIATKADAEEVEAKIAEKANAADVEAEMAKKADAAEVEAAINDSVAAAHAYTDGKVEAAINEHMVKKYEITSTPKGTLISYGEREIRVMCPADTKWEKQNVGSAGNANMYYMGFKAYAPEGAVSFKEGDRGTIVDEMFTFDDDFAGTDEYGRNYSICWLALASYDVASDTWTYFGKNSTINKYIGWTYVVEWYDANGVVIASDCVRINLSNENCHSIIEPFYVHTAVEEVKAYTDKQIEEVLAGIEVVEF